MARLRDPQRGCPWDLEQTFATIAPYTIEEAYEVADAIERGDREQLRDELGDLLFQVVFHARMAEERGWFDFAARGRAHPREAGAPPSARVRRSQRSQREDLARVWEEQKARSAPQRGRAGPGGGVLAGVPRALPALVRAAKLGRRAGRVGFDWPDARAGARQGARGAAGAGCGARRGSGRRRRPAQAVPSWRSWAICCSRSPTGAGICKFDAEEALRAANAKFERRFRAHGDAARSARGLELEALSAAEWDALWQRGAS